MVVDAAGMAGFFLGQSRKRGSACSHCCSFAVALLELPSCTRAATQLTVSAVSRRSRADAPAGRARRVRKDGACRRAGGLRLPGEGSGGGDCVVRRGPVTKAEVSPDRPSLRYHGERPLAERFSAGRVPRVFGWGVGGGGACVTVEVTSGRTNPSSIVDASDDGEGNSACCFKYAGRWQTRT